MIAFGHTAVGVGVGLVGYHLLSTQAPIIGLAETGLLGIASHYAADFIPHGHFFHHNEFKSKIIYAIIFDLFLSIILYTCLSLWLYGPSLKFWYILFGIGGAQLPDVLDGLITAGALPDKGLIALEHKFHQSTHWHGIFKNGRLIEGLMMRKSDVWQLTVVCVALYSLFYF